MGASKKKFLEWYGQKTKQELEWEEIRRREDEQWRMYTDEQAELRTKKDTDEIPKPS